MSTNKFVYPTGDFRKFTHYLFRYPAKFHPPVVQKLLDEFSKPGDTVLDPFCGSGTLLIEGMVKNRNVIGVDVDPFAVFVSRVKTTRVSANSLKHSVEQLLESFDKFERSETDYRDLQFNDISHEEFEASVTANNLTIPEIPNLHLWFRRYVILDLCQIRDSIRAIDIPEIHRKFLWLWFGSIIRNSSNADPVPVSGLEVTSHMKDRDQKGRIVNPFSFYRRIVKRSSSGIEEFQNALDGIKPGIKVVEADTTKLSYYVRRPVDTVITSPPYHNAVDYYRRHTLEMYWLGLVSNHADRLEILPKYIGRPKVRQSHKFVRDISIESPLINEWEKEIRRIDTERADAFKHYMVSMKFAVEGIAKCLPLGKQAIFVLGKNSWNGVTIPSTELFEELAKDKFRLQKTLFYNLKNRYMTYKRHNKASIDKEYILVMNRI